MHLDDKPMVLISEANRDFSRVAALAERHGTIYIVRDNKPKYKLIDVEQDTTIDMTDDEKIDFVATRILKLYRPAFEELAK